MYYTYEHIIINLYVLHTKKGELHMMIKNMSLVDSNSTTSTEVVNKKHKIFCLSSKLEYFAK